MEFDVTLTADIVIKKGNGFIVEVKDNAKKSLLTRPNCKMWSCEPCAANNARLWIAKVINGINRIGGEWSFLTITAHKKHRKEKSVANLRQGWKKLYNRILAFFGKKATNIYYCKVWEQHADGGFHLHILLSVCLGTRWAKNNAAECGLGFQADWRKVDNAGQVAGYAAKYTLKNAQIARGNIQWPKGLRRIETSRNWPILPKLDQESAWSWIIKMSRGEQLASGQRFFARGFDVLDLTKE